MIYFILGMLYTYLLDLSVKPFKIKWRKQAKYNCKICKVWDCPKKRCMYLEKKIKK